MSRAAEAAAMMDTGRDTAAVQTVATHDENNAETGLRASVEVLGEERRQLRRRAHAVQLVDRREVAQQLPLGLGIAVLAGADCAHLKALLEQLDVAPPYVFVGHSWGPTIALDYAARYPGEVVGSVYVDPTNIHTSSAAHDDMLRSLGATDAQLAELRTEPAALYAEMGKQMPPELWSELEFVVGLDKRDPASWVPAQPRVPTIVLLAGRRDSGGPPPPALIATLGEDAVDKRVRASHKQAFEARVQGVPGSAVRVVADAGHNIHEGNPGVVARAIDEVLAALVTR